MVADSIREQPLCVWQGENPFCKSVKRGFAQALCLWCDTLNRSATGNEPVRPLAAISCFVVGSAVFKPLDYVLFLYKLAFDFLFLGL